MNRLGLVAALGLASCSAGKDAEERYRIVEASKGSSAEKCAAARAVAEGYLKDKNLDQYKSWNMTAKVDCMSADLDRQPLY